MKLFNLINLYNCWVPVSPFSTKYHIGEPILFIINQLTFHYKEKDNYYDKNYLNIFSILPFEVNNVLQVQTSRG